MSEPGNIRLNLPRLVFNDLTFNHSILTLKPDIRNKNHNVMLQNQKQTLFSVSAPLRRA